MTANNNITPSDADLKLARSIDELNQGLIVSDQIDDPLFPLLQQFKAKTKTEVPHLQNRANEIWSKIELELDEKPASIHQMPDSSHARIWAIAASVLLIAFMGIFWLINRDSMQLVGQSGMQMATLNLEDGSEVTLRPNSRLWKKQFSDDEQIYLLDGEAFFDVVSNPERRFSVEAGDAVVTVLGTRFIVNNWGDTGSVFLEEGRVRFETRDASSSVELSPGESSRIRDGAVMQPVSGEAEVYTDWLNNLIVLEGQTTAQLFAELEQHYDIRLSAEADIYSDTLGGSIQLNSLNQTLDDLSTVLGGTFRKTGDNQYRFIPLD